MRHVYQGMALLAGLVLVASAWGGGGWSADRDVRRREVLERLPSQPDLLINLDASDLPGTTDMVRLGKRGTPAVVNGLINSMSAEVRSTCASVLVATRDARAIGPLLDALEDPNQWVRRTAVRALGNIDSRQATPRLVALLEKKRAPEDMKSAVVGALGRLGDPIAIKPLLRRFERRHDKATATALWNLRRHLSKRQLRKLVVSPMKAAVGGARVSGDVLKASVKRAGVLKLKAARRPLVQLFEGRESLRNGIVHTLGLIGDREAVGFLRGLLDRSAQPRLLNNVVFALDRLGQDTAPFLREALKDRRAYIRFNAAFVVGDLGQKALWAALVEGLADHNDFVRAEVAKALGALASPEAIPALERASDRAHEKNPIVRREALLALASIDYKTYRQRVLDELVTSRIQSVRERAVGFLATRRDPEVVSAVLAVLDPQDWSDGRAAQQLLARFWTLKSPAATAFLLRGGDEDQIKLLARFKDPAAAFILQQWLTQPNRGLNQLLRAAGRYKNKASLPLLNAWFKQSKNAEAQLYAAFALSSLGDARGDARLLSALENDPVYLKRIAAILLTQLDMKALPKLEAALVAMLGHEDVYVRIYAMRGLLQGGHPAAVAGLWAELDRKVPFIRDEALDVLERTPKAVRDTFIAGWIKRADTHLARALKRIERRR